ncbi:uncharacterized protein LOC120227466, partial [Hyaena hyaena]|uniref:uncharacterized protein LOC120227466 n=1 Tax=Hyaena hyaena TaxID=95912 RepID=UPI00192420BB
QWEWYSGYYWDHKVFGPGTLLRVTDKRPDEDTSPKPTIFLPSDNEVQLHKARTYLCLLEDFFPDVIKIDWKEKNGKTILKSQQGNTMRMKDTYMKYTWLTVTEKSMDKEHKCIVTHETNKGKVDQEILFPSRSKADLVTGAKAGFQTESERRTNTRAVTPSLLSTRSSSPLSSAANPTRRKTTENSYSTGTQDTTSPVTATTPPTDLVTATGSEVDFQRHTDTWRNTGEVTVSPLSSLSSSPVSRAIDPTRRKTTENSYSTGTQDTTSPVTATTPPTDPLQLQRMSTSAYYTYVLLLAKSVVYSILIAYCLHGKPALCDNGKSSQ